MYINSLFFQPTTSATPSEPATPTATLDDSMSVVDTLDTLDTLDETSTRASPMSLLPFLADKLSFTNQIIVVSVVAFVALVVIVVLIVVIIRLCRVDNKSKDVKSKSSTASSSDDVPMTAIVGDGAPASRLRAVTDVNVPPSSSSSLPPTQFRKVTAAPDWNAATQLYEL